MKYTHFFLFCLVAVVSSVLKPLAPERCGSNFNSLAPGKFAWNFKQAIFKQILLIDGWGISCEIALIWMSLDFTDDQSTMVQVMAWCRQATNHYLSQCWPRSMSPYGVTRPQGVKSAIFEHMPSIMIMSTSLRCMPQNPNDDKSTLVPVMAWCHQAPSHYLSWCWPKSLSPYGITRPQWVNGFLGLTGTWSPIFLNVACLVWGQSYESPRNPEEHGSNWP